MPNFNQANSHAFHEFGLDRLEAMKAKGFEPACIFDVGASDGRWTESVLPLFPNSTFHLFEPQANIEPEYQEKISGLVSRSPNASLHTTAIGSKVGTVTFNLSDNPVGSTSLTPANPARYQQVESPLATLDSVIEQGAAIPQLVKMDIQGAELDALRGFEKNLAEVEVLLLETWLSRGYGPNTPLIHELIEFLLPYDFHMFDLGSCYRNPAGNLVSQDFFFVNKNTCGSLASDYRF